MKYCYLTLFVVLTFSCHNNVQTDRILVQVDSLLYSRPDSALNILEPITPKDIKGPKQQAYYALLLSQAYDKNYIDIADDSLIRVAYNYYNRIHNQDVRKQALSCYYLGQVQVNGHDFESATISFLEAIKYGGQKKDHYLLGLSHTQLAMIYEDQDLFPQAIEHYQKALTEYSFANLHRHKIQSLIKIGDNYGHKSDYNTALDYYNRAKELAAETNDIVFLLNIGKNVGSIYYRQENIKAAKQHLLSAYQIYNNGIVPDFHSDNLLMGAIYSKEGKTDSARYFFNRALLDDNIYNMAAVEYELYILELNDEKFKQSIQHLHNHYALLDSIHFVNQQKSVFEIEKKYETTQLEYENYKQRVTHRNFIIGLIIVSILIITSSILLYRRHKNIIQNRDNQIKNYLLALSEADNSMSSILNTRIEKERKLKELLEKRFYILSKYYEIAYSWHARPEQMNQKIEELISLDSIEHDTFTILRGVVEQRHNGFFETLKETKPELSDNDINLLCLVVCKFSTQQMCAVYNTNSLQTVYTKKYRLAVKLNLQQGETLESFLLKYIIMS